MVTPARIVSGVVVLLWLLAPQALAYPIVSGDLEFDASQTPKNAGSGQLDILLFTGNAVANPPGLPSPNSTMPGGNKKDFSGR